MKKITAFLCGLALLSSPLLALSARAAPALSENTTVSVAPGYDYERFKDAGVSLNVYNWGEYISTGTDGESLNINAAFTELTGIKVNYTTFETNEILYAKLASGGAEYDIIIPSDYMIGKMVKENMLANLNFDNIPNYSMIGEQYKNQDYDPTNAYSVPYTWGYVGLIYNTTMVEEAPTSWDVLWDERYKDNILMFDNSRDAFAIAARKLGLPMNPENTAQIDQCAKELLAQRGIVQAYVMDQIFDKMEGNEAAVAPYYAGDAINMTQANPNLAFAVPKEGTNYFVDAACIPKNSKNQEAAEMYINFLCETEVARANCLFIGYSTPQVEAEAALPEELRTNPIAYPSSEILANTWTFNVLPDELNKHMDKAWVEVKNAEEGGGGWLIPVFLVAALVLAFFVVWRSRVKKQRNNY